jgi:hypothetical protein
MSKQILLFFLLAYSGSVMLNGQTKKETKPTNHSKWVMTTKRITECEYDLLFTVTLDPGWSTFSIVKGNLSDEDVFPTLILLDPHKDYSTLGPLTESKPTPEYDPATKKTFLMHYNKAVFTQRIRVNSGAAVRIQGKYVNHLINNTLGVGYRLPRETFNFDIPANKACKN